MPKLNLTKFSLVLTVCLLSAGCASNAGKYAFTADDYDMAYVDSQHNAQTVSKIEDLVNKQFSACDVAFAKIDTTLQPMPDQIKGPIAEQVATIKVIINGKIRNPLLDVAHNQGSQLVKYLGTYDVFEDKNVDVRYNLIDRLSDDDANAADLNPVIDQANDVLKRTYKVTKQLVVAKELMAHAQKDIAGLKTAPDIAKTAGIGLVTVSIARSTLSSLQDAQVLAPKLQAVLTTLQSKIQANPALALKLGGTVSQVSGASANLLGVTKDAPAVLGGVSDLLKAMTN